MKHPINQTWNLDEFFSGGSNSESFKRFLNALQADISCLKEKIMSLPPLGLSDRQSFVTITDQLQDLNKRLKHSDSFIACLTAQDQNDGKALLLGGRISQMKASLETVNTFFDQRLTDISDKDWLALLKHQPLSEMVYILNERRQWAKLRLPAEQEALLADVAVDGYHAWGDFYGRLVSTLKVPFMDKEGQVTSLSVSQAANELHHPDRARREELFAAWEQAWEGKEDLFADTINHLAGFRLQVYKYRGFSSVLQEPLHLNRCSQETLDAMWDVIESHKDVFIEYLNRKAALMELDQLSWHDVEAPLALGQATAVNSESSTISYDDAAELIVKQFQSFSPDMAKFAAMAFEARWIEAEDRAGKRPGGFCTGFPMNQQSRIFMTYAGTASNVSTLAHELGHAYHQYVMEDMPEFNQDYAMNVAETASTFAEWIVADALVKAEASHEGKLMLLEDKIQRSVAFFMNIHARYLFELEMYEQRSKGLLSAEQLNELMEKAQRKAFGNSLSTYHPRFWASKLHFYLTDVPFYNFPYTFGYMFSAGLFAQALEEGESFHQRYVNLLRDTGRMSVEQLAKKHLGVDLAKQDFWQNAISLTIRDVKKFLDLTKLH